MLLVYTHKITPRVRYIFKQICTRIIGIPVKFTTTIEAFIAHDSLKISYTRQPLSHEIFIKSNELLYEQGLSDLELKVVTWDDTKCFFANSEASALPFLQHHYPDFKFPERQYKITPVIDVPSAYAYKLKGVIRNLGGSIQDISSLKFKRLYQRYMVFFGAQKDPYDTFKYIIEKQKQVVNKFIFFFLIGDLSTYDKNVNAQKAKFQSLIKQVADYSKIGLNSRIRNPRRLYYGLY